MCVTLQSTWVIIMHRAINKRRTYWLFKILTIAEIHVSLLIPSEIYSNIFFGTKIWEDINEHNELLHVWTVVSCCDRIPSPRIGTISLAHPPVCSGTWGVWVHCGEICTSSETLCGELIAGGCVRSEKSATEAAAGGGGEAGVNSPFIYWPRLQLIYVLYSTSFLSS